MANEMIRKIKSGLNFYHNHGLVSTLHQIFINDYAVYCNLPPEQYEAALKQWFKRITGKTLDLQHPRTYSEKLQWLKLYDSTPIKTRLTDKYLVREWVKEKIGEEYLIPLLGVWNDFDEIDFEKLPDRFVLKATHGSGWNIIVRDKSKLNKRAARKKFKEWLNTNYAFVSGFELHYMNIQPRIIAEEYIEEAGYAFDYRFMCFNGKTEFIWFDTSAPPNRKRALYSTAWVRLEKTIGHYPPVEEEIAKPQLLEKMLQLAAILSQDFIHVRVDFYEIHGRIYFGEMTFTPVTGACEWNPPEQDRIYGDLLHLPAQKSPIPV